MCQMAFKCSLITAAQVHCDGCGGGGARTLLVEDAEGLNDLLLGVDVVHLTHFELWKIMALAPGLISLAMI